MQSLIVDVAVDLADVDIGFRTTDRALILFFPKSMSTALLLQKTNALDET
jgi:hypothetical protein